ncbi:peptidase T [Clostridium sp. DL1XJH146]
MIKVTERFLEYVKHNTKSDDESETVPSTSVQLEFAKFLNEELQSLGMENISLDDKGYLMAELPSNTKKKIPTVGFIAHMDTSPDISGEGVKPKIVKNYDGKDIILNEENNIVLSPKDFPEIKKYIGQDLITTDGNTLLGADDKAGIAEIITAMEFLMENPDIEHGCIKIGFTPDEEIGRGADYFDVEKFRADFAYTMDGGEIGELEYENFNAARADINIKGRNVHPGTAKNKMINSISIGNELVGLLPKEQVPEKTEGYEGFYLLMGFEGTVENTKLKFIIRDHDREKFENKKKIMKDIEVKLNNKYGKDTVEIQIKDQYYNMKEKLEPVMHIVEAASEAMKTSGVTPLIQPIRGGTDGARLSFMGLPTPNIFTGGHNFHGRYEYIPINSMEKAVEVIINIVKYYSNK